MQKINVGRSMENQIGLPRKPSSACPYHCYPQPWRTLSICSKWHMEIRSSLWQLLLIPGILYPIYSSPKRWLIDSGATDHMTSNYLFSSYSPFPSPIFISLADGSKVLAIGKGSVHLLFQLNFVECFMGSLLPYESPLWLHFAPIVLVKWFSDQPPVFSRIQGGRLGMASMMASCSTYA